MTKDILQSNLINTAILHLLNFEEYTDFTQAARQAAVNSRFQIVIFSEDFTTLFSVETRHVTSIEAAVQSARSQVRDREKKGSKVDVDGVTTYWGPCKIAKKKYYLMLVDNEKIYTQEEIVKLASIIELAMGMWNYVPSRDTKTELVRALRRGNKDLAKNLLAELRIPENEIDLVFHIPQIKASTANLVVSKLNKINEKNAIIVFEQDEISGILLKSSDRENLRAILEAVSDSLTKIFFVHKLSGSEEACGAFRLIGEAEAFSGMIFPYRQIFSKYEMVFAENCASICMSNTTSKKNYLELIKPLLANDTKSKQLRETLSIYILDAEMSVAKASEILNIHVNTVQYRLKRVREILGVDITSNNIVPALTTALALTRIEKEAGPF